MTRSRIGRAVGKIKELNEAWEQGITAPKDGMNPKDLHNFCTNTLSCLIFNHSKKVLAAQEGCGTSPPSPVRLGQNDKNTESKMSGQGRKRGPLVADKRYSNSKAKPKRKAAPSRKAKRRAAPRTRTARRGILGWLLAPFVWLFRIVWKLTWRLGLAVAVLTGLGVWFYASQLPPITELVDARTRGSVILQDREGARFASRGELFGGMITAETVSPHLRNAVVATEDKRFGYHFGIDPYATVAAMYRNYSQGRNPLSGAGGSSITQQAAKLLCNGVPYDPNTWDNEREYEADCRRTTLWRKIKEAVFAMAMEARYSKDEILTIYLNRVYMGGGARGAEAAAQRFFGISAREVNPAQAAMLAGVIRAPSVTAPTANLQRAQDRAATVIRLMREQGYLSNTAATEAQSNPAVLSEAAAAKAGGYFADWALDGIPDFLTQDTTEDIIVKTTLDQDIQTAAENALLWVFENKVKAGSEAEAAIVVMSPDGAVRAMVGGRDVRASGAFNRATQANRQTGSAFKPFIYATALELGFSPNDTINDTPLTISVPGSGNWEPKNYDRQFKGQITLTQALAESRNIPAVVLSEEVGRELVRTVAQGFGIESDLAAGPALALGVSESTLIEMTGAYAGILNGGSSVRPYGLTDLRLLGDAEPLMTNAGAGIGERVINESAARQLTWMLSQVVEYGTGTRAQMPNWQVAGKSGTTNSQRDAWFIGFTGDYVTGVWMGYDDNRPMSGVTGGGLPADIWREAMTRITAGWQPTRLPMQAPIARSGAGTISSGNIVADQEINNVLENILQGLPD